MNEQQQWYVTIAGSAVGPVSTDLVLRGIKHRKIATEAYVCVVGASEWQALVDVPEFHGALKENGLLPAAASNAQQPTNGSDSTLASITAAQAAELHGQGAEAHASVEDDDESETTAQFPSSRFSDFEHQQNARAPAAGPRHEEHSEIANAALLSSQPAPALQREAMGSIPTGALAPDENTTLPSPDAALAEQPAYVRDTSERTYQTAAISAPNVAEQPAAEAERPLPGEPRNGKHTPALESQAQMLSIEVDIDMSMDEPAAPSIDWNHGFSDYFLVDAEVTLPDDQLLLRSLTNTAHDTFLHDEPMWNLALCLAFGSNPVASVAADVFFDVVATHGNYERIEWMARTLLSRGFMPSGIPHTAGNRGIGRLRQACPDELRVQLESQLGL